MSEYWVVVWQSTGAPIVPFDCNPNHADQGMLVYRSKEAATSAAEHQQRLYGNDDNAGVVSLSEIDRLVTA